MGLFDSLAAPAPQSLDPNNPQTVLSPDAVKRRQLLADALSKEGSDASPVRSGWQVAARVAQGLLGGYYSGQADQADAAGAAESVTPAGNTVLSAVISGAEAGGAAVASTYSSGQPSNVAASVVAGVASAANAAVATLPTPTQAPA